MLLHCRQAGSGEPLLLIHGLFGSLENLASLARSLAEHFCVYSIDLPNHGRSPHSDQLDLESMTEAVAAWLREQQLGTVYCVGHSLGGKVAMELALRFPEEISRLVVMDIAPVHYDPHHHSIFEALLSLQVDSLHSRNEADKHLREYIAEPAVRSFLLKNLVKGANGRYQWRMNLLSIYADYPHLIKANRSDSSFDGPVLFLKGGNSDYIQANQKDRVISRFPNAELKIVADTGHWLHVEKPSLVAKLVGQFLS